jgi:octaprenyl-diphosphate synthase
MYNKIKENVSEDLLLFEAKLSELLRAELKSVDIVLEYINSNYGKRLRPMVMFLISGLFSKNDTLQEQVIDYAVSIEAAHQATLIHDDVVDNSKERRNKASVNSIWDNKVSVLIGDYMFAKCFGTLYKYKDFEATNIIAEVLKAVTEGEILALELSNTLSQTEDTYYRIIYSKTASLIEASCKIASMIYTDNVELIDSLAMFGKNIGMAFQMRDDLFDYTDDNKLIGKPVGNDIKEHQITLPLIYALNNSSTTERERILSILKLAIISDAQIKDIISFTKSMRGLDYAENKAKEFINTAIKCLDIFPEGDPKDRLIDFAHYMVDRQK